MHESVVGVGARQTPGRDDLVRRARYDAPGEDQVFWFERERHTRRIGVAVLVSACVNLVRRANRPVPRIVLLPTPGPVSIAGPMHRHGFHRHRLGLGHRAGRAVNAGNQFWYRRVLTLSAAAAAPLAV